MLKVHSTVTETVTLRKLSPGLSPLSEYVNVGNGRLAWGSQLRTALMFAYIIGPLMETCSQYCCTRIYGLIGTKRVVESLAEI